MNSARSWLGAPTLFSFSILMFCCASISFDTAAEEPKVEEGKAVKEEAKEPSAEKADTAKEKESFTFVQLCDTQGNWGNFEIAVKQINALKPDFVVICGDLVNKASRASFNTFLKIKSGFTVTVYCVPGNHDIGGNPSPKALALYRLLFKDDYKMIKHKGHAFVLTNTSLWKNHVDGESDKHDAWFDKSLEQATNEGLGIFVYGHYPPFLKKPGEKESYKNLPIKSRTELIEKLAKHKAIAFLAGHTHREYISNYKGTKLLAGRAISFGQKPYGFYLWTVGGKEKYQHSFIELNPGPKKKRKPKKKNKK